jgi:glycosyltransferase involved in cell wall biosynthesis
MSTVVEKIAAPAALERPQRVLLLTQASGGGVGRHFLDLAEGLHQRGVSAVGIYSPRKLDTACRARLEGGILPAMHSFPMRRGIHPLDVVDLRALERLIRQLGPFDLVHGHSSKGGALARLLGRRLGIPAVYTPNTFVTQDYAVAAWQRAVFALIERWLGRHTAALIAVSHEEAEHARALGVDPAKVHVVPNGIDPPPFLPRDEARARLGILPDEMVFGFVGRLAPQKAPEVMLRAFAQVLTNLPAARLVMVGSGPQSAEVGDCVEQLGLKSRVLLLGDVVAMPIMRAFDAFCLSSRYEGMPYVLIEALAAGLPIITTRVGGALMCVEPGVNGLIVPVEDTGALAGAMINLAGDADMRRRFAAASAALAARYTAQRMVDQTLRVYQEVWAARAPRG